MWSAADVSACVADSGVTLRVVLGSSTRWSKAVWDVEALPFLVGVEEEGCFGAVVKICSVSAGLMVVVIVGVRDSTGGEACEGVSIDACLIFVFMGILWSYRKSKCSELKVCVKAAAVSS